MNRLQVLVVAIVFANSLVSTACQQVKQVTATIGGLISLSKDIGAKFGEPSVSCNLMNGTSLTIDIVNSSRRGLPDEPRRAAALDIARYAYAHYDSRDHLSAVGVRFVRHWSIVIFTYNDATDLFAFTGDDLSAWYKQQTSQPPSQLGAKSEGPPNNRLKQTARGRSGAEALRRTRAAA